LQSKLPDLNEYWKKYHEKGDAALQRYDYESCVNAFDCMDALMPEEYVIEVNTTKYEDLLKNNDFVCCKNCNADSNWNDVKVIDLFLPLLESIIVKSSTYKAWICLECKYENKLSETKLNKTRLKKPYFFKIIPEAQKVPIGLERRTQFNTKMNFWWHNAKAEMDHQLALIRQEYTPEDEDPDTEDGGEE